MVFRGVLNLSWGLRHTSHTLIIVLIDASHMCGQLLGHRRSSERAFFSHDVLGIGSRALVVNNWPGSAATNQLLVMRSFHEDLIVNGIHFLFHKPNDILELPWVARLFPIFNSLVVMFPNYLFFSIRSCFVWFFLGWSSFLTRLLLTLRGCSFPARVFVGGSAIHVLSELCELLC